MPKANALKTINKIARTLKREHPSMKHTSAIKAASAIYRRDHGKVSGTKKRSSVKKAAVKKIKKYHRAEGRFHKAEGRAIKKAFGGLSTMQAAAIGRITTSQHMAHARAQLKEQIGFGEAQRFAAKTKMAKRKIGKYIAKLKTQYRKLC